MDDHPGGLLPVVASVFSPVKNLHDRYDAIGAPYPNRSLTPSVSKLYTSSLLPMGRANSRIARVTFSTALRNMASPSSGEGNIARTLAASGYSSLSEKAR